MLINDVFSWVFRGPFSSSNSLVFFYTVATFYFLGAVVGVTVFSLLLFFLLTHFFVTQMATIKVITANTTKLTTRIAIMVTVESLTVVAAGYSTVVLLDT
jgi:hypothetical protein